MRCIRRKEAQCNYILYCTFQTHEQLLGFDRPQAHDEVVVAGADERSGGEGDDERGHPIPRVSFEEELELASVRDGVHAPTTLQAAVIAIAVAVAGEGINGSRVHLHRRDDAMPFVVVPFSPSRGGGLP